MNIATPVVPSFRDIAGKARIIDADTHWSEPHELWTSRAPAKWKDRVPQIKTLDGVPSWVIDGDKPIGYGAHPASFILKDGTKLGLETNGLPALQMHDVHPGSSQVKERLQFMDDNNVAAQVIYGNLLGFGGERTVKVDPDLRLLCLQLYNDALAEMQEASGDRIYGMAMLPWWDLADSIAEARRCAKMGLRGVNINSDPHLHPDNAGNRLPDLCTPHWNRLWEVCIEEQLPVNFHIGASEQVVDWAGNAGFPSLTYDIQVAIGATSTLFMTNGRVLANLIYGGVLDNFPELKLVSVESGIGWIPFLLEALDYQYHEAVENKQLKLKPSEYFQRNFYGCFWFERQDIAHMIRRVGVDNVMFETDFPHPTCLYPIDDVETALDGLTEEEKAKILFGNAAELYRMRLA